MGDVEADDPDEAALRQESERITQLLDDLGEIGGAPVLRRAEELVARLVHLYGTGLGRLLRILGGLDGDRLDDATKARLHADPLVSSLLVLHGLHPVPEAAHEFDPGPGASGRSTSASASGLVQIDLTRRPTKSG